MKTLSPLLLLITCVLSSVFCWTSPTSFVVPPPVADQARKVSCIRTTFTRVYSQIGDERDDDAALQEAKLLKQKAEKARLEAQQMEQTFVDEQLHKLELLLAKQARLTSSTEQQDIQEKINRLKEYRNTKKPKQQSAVDASSNQTKNKEEVTKQAVSVDRLNDEDVSEEDDVIEELDKERVGDLSGDDRKALGEIKSIFLELQDAVNSTFHDDELAEAFRVMSQGIENALTGNITQEELDVIKGIKSFVSWIPGLNKEKLIKTIVNGTKLAAEIQEMEKEDPLYGTRLSLFTDFFPERRQNMGVTVNQTDIQEFVDKVIHPNNESFSIKATPHKVGNFYLVEGTPQILDGDVLVDRLDEQLQHKSGLRDVLQYFYVRDPSVNAELDEVQMADLATQALEEGNFQKFDNMEPPALLVVPAEYAIAPDQESLFKSKAILPSLAVLSTAIFAGQCYNPDGNEFDHIVAGFSHPVVLYGLLGLSLARELGRFATGALNKASNNG